MLARTTRQGLPQATVLAGISRVTTLPAPMTTLSPIVTPRQQDGPAADPHMVADDDRRGLRLAKGERPVRPRRAEPLGGVGGVERGVNLHVGRDQHIVAYDDAVIVQKRAVHVHFAVVAKIDVVAVIRIKRRGDPQVGAAPAQQFGQNAVFLRRIGRIQAVIVPHQVFGFVPLGQQLGVAAVIQLPGQHLFAFGYGGPSLWVVWRFLFGMDGLSMSLPRVNIPAGGALQFEISTGGPQNPD